MYKTIPFTHALGAATANKVLAEFSVGEDASRSLRVEVVTDAAEDTAIKLQHSMVGDVWVDVKTSAETAATTHTIIINVGDVTALPLKPKCRIIANVTMDVAAVYVARNI